MFGDLSRTAAGCSVLTVIKSAHSFNHRDIGAGGIAMETFFHPFPTHHPKIKVDGILACGQAVITAIDIIRADFKRLYHETFLLKQAHQGKGKRCLTNATAGSRDKKRGGGIIHDPHEPFQKYHREIRPASPFWAPESKSPHPGNNKHAFAGPLLRRAFGPRRFGSPSFGP